MVEPDNNTPHNTHSNVIQDNSISFTSLADMLNSMLLLPSSFFEGFSDTQLGNLLVTGDATSLYEQETEPQLLTNGVA